VVVVDDDPPAATVVLVEGPSDAAAVGALAERLDRDLLAEGVHVEVADGVTNFPGALARLVGTGPVGQGGREARARDATRAESGARRPARRVLGLYDEAEEAHVRRGLRRVGLGADLDRNGIEACGFFVCVADLEDELIRALGPAAVEAVLDAQGELRAFRMFQRQPAQRGRPVEAQLRRFMGTRSLRKIRYGRLLVDALDLERVPLPLDRLLARI
jgi:hypothetical protein